MKRYVYFQPNDLDLKDEYGDCTIRALCKIYNRSWQEVFDMLIPIIKRYQLLPGYMFHSEHADIIAQHLGLVRQKVSNKKGTTRPTVVEFAKAHPQGIYLCKVAHHVVAVVNGQYFDTWDSGFKPLYAYYEYVGITRGKFMASESKKKKAKNSYIANGGEKPNNFRCKRVQYFTKQNRIKVKKSLGGYFD